EMITGDVSTYLDDAVETNLLIESHEETFIFIILQHTFLVGVSKIEIGSRLFVAVGDAKVVTGDYGCCQHEILPVCVSCIIIVIEWGSVQVRELHVIELLETRSVCEFDPVLHTLNAHRTLKVDACLPSRCFLRSNGDHTIRATKTVDRDGRRI